MALTSEQLFTGVMQRAWERNEPYFMPWWVQQTLRRPVADYDTGLFDSATAAFASNALYRYWSMIGVKDAGLESLVGQYGEVAPVYEAYSVLPFLFEPDGRRLHLPGRATGGTPAPTVAQQMLEDHLPVVVTELRTDTGLVLTSTALSTTVGDRQRSIVLQRMSVRAEGSVQRGWLCVAVLPSSPSSFQRHDRAGRYVADRQIPFLRYLPAESRVEVGSGWGPVFDTPPSAFGLHGNAGSVEDPAVYLTDSPFADLLTSGTLNGVEAATDHLGLMCSAVFAWPFDLTSGAPAQVDVRLPVDDHRGGRDLAAVRALPADELEARNRHFWTDKLDGQGLQVDLPPAVAHLGDLFKLCRANVLILADGGQIHPGPTIYDSFWVRDSAIEGIACALVGDLELASRQFLVHYPAVFHLGNGSIGPVREYGFFGGEHERNDREWDSNGEALWAFGRLDRIAGPAPAFGARLFAPYVLEGARWIRDNRSAFGLLHSGWSAEHLGGADAPHYWDDLWGIAGLREAARLAERIGAPATAELWAAHDDLRAATAASISWVLDQQRRAGIPETFIPTGPADVGRLDSTIIGAVAYFHPCRLYSGQQLGAEVDVAARLTLETIWARHVRDGGFRHDSAWRAFGPYLTLQLAHAFLFTGDVDRMDACLAWAVRQAAYATVTPPGGGNPERVVHGAWNEQHAYAVSSDFREVPQSWWYMGDLPHGWAAAEFEVLLRDICFFEADEDGSPHVYLAPGVPAHWLRDGEELTVRDAPTSFGTPFGFTLRHDAGAREVTIDVVRPLPDDVFFIYPCRFGVPVSVVCDGRAVAAGDRDVRLPARFRRAVVTYS